MTNKYKSVKFIKLELDSDVFNRLKSMKDRLSSKTSWEEFLLDPHLG